MRGRWASTSLGDWADLTLVVVALLWLFATPYVAVWLSRQVPWGGGWPSGVLLSLVPILIPGAILRRAYRRRLRWAAVTSAIGVFLYVVTALLPLLVWQG